GGIGGVHRLATRTRRPVYVDLELVVVDRDIDLFRLREDGYRRGGGVAPALILRGRHPPDAVRTRVVAQIAIGVGAANDENRFLHPARCAFRVAEHLYTPFPRFGVAGIHAEEVAGEKSRFVAPGSSPNLNDGVTIIERVTRHEEEL